MGLMASLFTLVTLPLPLRTQGVSLNCVQTLQSQTGTQCHCQTAGKHHHRGKQSVSFFFLGNTIENSNEIKENHGSLTYACSLKPAGTQVGFDFDLKKTIFFSVSCLFVSLFVC